MVDFFDAAERTELSDLLDRLGPDAPTLLDPWTARDLAAHLVLREYDYLAAPGLVLPGPWGAFAERRRTALASTDFSALVARIRSGPRPGFFRLGPVRRGPNLNEYFVHHEDVRRANGLGPRTPGLEMERALWGNVSAGCRFLARRLRGVGLELRWADAARSVRIRPGRPEALVTGPPGELLLFLFGRKGAAKVQVSGSAAAVDAVQRAHLGM